MSRKYLLIFLYTLLAGVLLASCAAPQTGTTGDGSAAPADEVTIRFLTGDAYFPAEPTEDNPNPPTAMRTLVEEYEADNPGVNIELVEVPSDMSSDTWRITVFQGGNEPHILNNNYIRVWQEQTNGWYLPLNDYIEQPNPYIPEGTPGIERWADSIPEEVWNTTLHSTGNQYLVTVDAVAVGMFYDTAVFEEVGIDTEAENGYSIWSDWEEMMADMARLEEAGYETPLSLSMSTAAPFNYNWIDGVVLTSVYRDLIPELYAPSEGEEWHVLTQQEVACGIQTGMMSASDPQFSDFVDIVNNFQQYWIPGYTTVSADESYRAFITQESPMLLANAAADISRILRDAEFEFDVTYFPPLQGSTSEYAENVDTSYLVGGFTAGYTVSDRAEREGITDEVVDFLMYITAQPQWSQVVEDAPRSVPTLRELDVPPALQSLTPFLQLPIRAFKDPDPRLTKRYGEEHRRLMQEYFTGQISKDDLVSAEDDLMQSEAEKVLAENEWTCDYLSQ